MAHCNPFYPTFFRLALVGCFALFCFLPFAGISQSSSEKFTFKIIPSIENTWGYDIYQDGKICIHQPHIPSVAGTKGFQSPKVAERVAKAIIQKLKKGIMPPSISYEELQKLRALP